MFDDLSMYLGPKGKVPGIGPERGPARVPQQGIVRFRSPHGSSRYLAFRGGEPVSVLQIVSFDGEHAQIANVYTVPEFRRRGLAEQLLARARKDFASVEHSKHLSESGRLWKEKVSPQRDRQSARRRGRRDPNQTLDRIAWLAREAGESDAARQILHDALLEADDVERPLIYRLQHKGEPASQANFTAIRTLAADYRWHGREAERMAEYDNQKRVIVFTPMAMVTKEGPFSFMRHSYATEYLPAGNVAVYTTAAGRWGKLTA